MEPIAKNLRIKSAVLVDAEVLTDAAEDCRCQGFIHRLNRLEAIALELDSIAAQIIADYKARQR